MRSYSIVDLLVDTYYAPTSLSRRFNGGTINHAEKREDVYAGEEYETFAIRYRPTGSLKDEWATVAVRISDY
jgi:preprotein translocase subunit SecA